MCRKQKLQPPVKFADEPAIDPPHVVIGNGIETQNMSETQPIMEDVLTSGNVGSKTKLFETLAQHVKEDVDEQNAYKTPIHSLRKKTERSRTIHTTFRRPISPDDDEQTMLDSFARPVANVEPSFEEESEDTRTSKNATPPSSSEDNFEDEKSKLSLSEKAKFFEIKSQESKLRNKRFQQRHKTQPVTQVSKCFC